jgi:hypothetical protein
VTNIGGDENATTYFREFRWDVRIARSAEQWKPISRASPCGGVVSYWRSQLRPAEQNELGQREQNPFSITDCFPGVMLFRFVKTTTYTCKYRYFNQKKLTHSQQAPSDAWGGIC